MMVVLMVRDDILLVVMFICGIRNIFIATTNLSSTLPSSSALTTLNSSNRTPTTSPHIVLVAPMSLGISITQVSMLRPHMFVALVGTPESRPSTVIAIGNRAVEALRRHVMGLLVTVEVIRTFEAVSGGATCPKTDMFVPMWNLRVAAAVEVNI